jgi:LPXTG-motif cell wall-anchored protein
MRRLLTAATMVAVFALAAPANAYVTDGLYLYMDARNTDSYSVSNSTEWNDISVNGRNGTINGSVTLDVSTDALFFDGTAVGTNYVDLSGAFDDWGEGFTVEFIGEFGANVDGYERIFDFGNGAESDNIWVGRFGNTNDLALEIWRGSANQGKCITTEGQLSGRELHHWIITVDAEAKCRIYQDGVEVQTSFQGFFEGPISAPTIDGSELLALPNDIVRTNNFVGASNWPDRDFEGSIQMIRIYTRALTVDDVSSADETTPTESGGGGDGDGDGDGGGSLANTGFDAVIMAALATAFVAGGLLLMRRRRRN